MSEMLRAAIVRVRRESDQQVVGVGFLVDVTKKTILTCAHVVNAAIDNIDHQGKPPQISIDFPFLSNGQRYNSRVLHLHPKNPEGPGDLAVLEIVEPLPEKAKAVRLAVTETYNGHEFWVYGFPQRFEESAQYVEGRLQERLANNLIQAIGTTNLGYFVKHGFSGSPVLDKQLNAVVGMMMQVDTESDIRVCFLFPIDVLAGLFTDLEFDKIEPKDFDKQEDSTPKINPSTLGDMRWLLAICVLIVLGLTTIFAYKNRDLFTSSITPSPLPGVQVPTQLSIPQAETIEFNCVADRIDSSPAPSTIRVGQEVLILASGHCPNESFPRASRLTTNGEPWGEDSVQNALKQQESWIPMEPGVYIICFQITLGDWPGGEQCLEPFTVHS